MTKMIQRRIISLKDCTQIFEHILYLTSQCSPKVPLLRMRLSYVDFPWCFLNIQRIKSSNPICILFFYSGGQHHVCVLASTSGGEQILLKSIVLYCWFSTRISPKDQIHDDVERKKGLQIVHAFRVRTYNYVSHWLNNNWNTSKHVIARLFKKFSFMFR